MVGILGLKNKKSIGLDGEFRKGKASLPGETVYKGFLP